MNIDLSMLRGIDLKFDENLQIKNPKLSEIFEVGYEKYSLYVTLITSSPYDLMVELNDIGIDFESVTHYQLFWNFYHSQDIYKEALHYFTGHHFEVVKDEKENVMLVNEKCMIDEFKFNDIVYFLKRINHLSLKQEYNPGNKTALLYLMEQKRKAQKRRIGKEKINIESIISSVAWYSNNGVNIFNIFDLTISQLYDGYFRLNRIDNWRNTMIGMYTGNISSKDIKLDNINWSNIIQTDN